jgi:hypothetical protein
MVAMSGKVPKVYWRHADGSVNVNHDDHVRDLIDQATKYADDHGLTRGVGVIDFADCTVVVLSQAIPAREVFVTERRGDNSIESGYGYLGDVLDITKEQG